MKPHWVVWLAACAGLVVTLSVTGLSGWFTGAVVAATLTLSVPLGIQRYRLERKLARSLWRALTTR